METATNNLENDHVQILRLIDVMEKLTRIPNPEVAHLEEVIFLIRNFADIFHHAKEEKMLFPMLIEKGFSPTQGPVGVMLAEHAEGRNFVKGMDENLSGYKQGDKKFLPALVDNLKGYIDLLREHIGKENHVLFPMANKMLTPDETQFLLGKIKEFTATSNFEDYANRLDKLAKIYDV